MKKKTKCFPPFPEPEKNVILSSSDFLNNNIPNKYSLARKLICDWNNKITISMPI